MSNHYKICDLCGKIPFATLPFEDEPGLPHQPSLKALKDSAKSCTLCDLILGASRLVRRAIDEEYKQVSQGTMTAFEPGRVLPSGKKIFGRSTQGRYAPGGRHYVGIPTEDQNPDKPGYAFGDDLSIRPWLFGNWWRARSPEDPWQLMGLGVRLAATPNVEDAEGNGKEKEIAGTRGLSVRFHGSYLRIRTEDASPFSHWIPGRLRVSDSSSKLSFDRICRWVQRCDANHNCTSPVPPLPTRVLDVRANPECITLIETSGQCARYIALSHCWGGSQIMMTKHDTMQDRKEGILIIQLPKTFQDVVSIARLLEVQYIWIDSLCIIQDDKSDWQREASKMAEVYANSYLTVAASSSPDSSSGCFPSWSTTRSYCSHFSSESISLGLATSETPAPILDTQYDDPQLLSRTPFAVVTTTPNNMHSGIYVHSEWLPSSTKTHEMSVGVGTFGLIFDPVAREPLNTRGWTLQERILSPRVLHCGTEQMFWQCHVDFLAEEGSMFIDKFISLDTIIRGQRLPLSRRGANSFYGQNWSGEPQPSQWGRWDCGWLATIEEYTSRNLTFGKDKLPAMAGLAKFVANATADKYYAGLWRDHIVEDLYWGVATSDSNSLQYPEVYRAPSWSWASLDAKVKFIPVDLGRAVAHLIECITVPAGIDPYGELRDGWVKLSAPLILVHRATTSDSTGREAAQRNVSAFGLLGAHIHIELRLNHGLYKGKAFFDIEPQFPCWALFLDPRSALLLKPEGFGNKFRRTGIGFFRDTEIIQYGRSEVIII